MLNEPFPAKHKLKMYYSSLVAAVSTVLVGMNLSFTNSIHSVFTECEPKKVGMLPSCVKCSQTQWSLFVALMSLGAPIANMILANFTFPKKRLLIAASTFYLMGALCIFSALNYYVLLCGRMLCGLAAGISYSVVPIYLAVISPLNMKAVICSFHPIGLLVGIFFGQLISLFFHDLNNWRIGNGILIGSIMLHIFFLAFIKNVYVIENEKKSNFKAAFSTKKRKIAFITTILAHFSQQASCIRGFIQYSHLFLKTTSDPKRNAVYLSLFMILGTVLTTLIIKKLRRRHLFLLSLGVTALGLILCSTNFNFLISSMIFIEGFCLGLGPIPWLMMGELIADECKDPVSRLAASVNWVTNFIFICVFSPLINEFKKQTFLIFASLMILLFVYFFLFYKEDTLVKE